MISLEEVKAKFPGYCITAFSAGFARSPEVNCILVLDTEEPSGAHVLVCPREDPHKRVRGSRAYKIKVEADRNRVYIVPSLENAQG